MVQIQAPTKPTFHISAHAYNTAIGRGLEPTFHSLLRTQFNQLRFSKRDPADVGEDVVRDDQHHWQKEPDHAFEDVVHDEVRLHDDQVERHVRPGELRELKFVVAFLE